MPGVPVAPITLSLLELIANLYKHIERLPLLGNRRWFDCHSSLGLHDPAQKLDDKNEQRQRQYQETDNVAKKNAVRDFLLADHQ